MIAPLTPVEAGLIALRKELPALVKERRLAHARAFLRKQLAEIATADVKFRVDVHEQKMEAVKDRLKELRDRSEIGRAINSNLKEELRVLGGGP